MPASLYGLHPLRKERNRVFASLRVLRVLFALLVAVLLGFGVSAIHSKPALAACVGSYQVLNSDTKVFNGEFTITVHTVLEELVGDAGFCGQLAAVTTVTLSNCVDTFCEDTGTVTAFVVGTNGARLGTASASIDLTDSRGHPPTSASVFAGPFSASCGAAGGTYVGSQGEHITSGSAQRCAS